MKSYIFTIVFSVLLLKTFAQFPRPQISSQSPNAAGISVFGEIPVSLYTGTPQINIPLYTLEEGKISVPISLSYHASGVRPNQGGEGIKKAYDIALENFIKRGNNRVILATDGDFNVGVSSESELKSLIEEKRESGVYLSVLGFGMGNYKDNRLELLADKGNGNYAYIDNINEARKEFVTEFGGTLFTVAKDVKLQLEFNPKYVKAYRLIGYENRKLKNEDFNNDKKDAGEMGSGHSVTAIYEIVPAGAESNYLTSTDPLKYQQPKKLTETAQTNEVLTIKLRYKLPDETTSKLIENVVLDKHTSFENTSDNFRMAASVAEFGLLLRQSEFKGKANFNHVIATARAAKGNDEEGYRAEFIKLVKMAQLLANEPEGEKE
ncbi:vWA domain-containing protein [Emticicia sp. 17c]|uniref:vWA domain-containing protein n=1 Tax=Emticicia sp. 17c TaxID=3127704 RepID=UPI00301C8AA9